MKAKVLEALKGSILKWKRIVRSPKANDLGEQNCPLCLLFPKVCRGCPVNENTSRSFCNDTVYRQWINHQYGVHSGFNHKHRALGCKECLRLAKAELAFLESLLPKGAKP